MPASESCELAAFDTPLARAVVKVLRASGLPAALGDEAAGEAAVLVPAGRREEALTVLAARMDDVQAEAGRAAGRPPGPAAAPATAHATHTGAVGEASWIGADVADGANRPLVLERFRRLGWVAAALVPLLVVTLAGVRLPAGAVTLAILGSVVLLAAWRSGRLGGRG